jgi:hypothetical protein
VPAGVRLEAVPDAEEPCPVCGSAEWARVVAAPPGRFPTDGAERPTAALCGRCGYEEPLGVLYGPIAATPPAADAGAEAADDAATTAVRDELRRADRAAVRAAAFPLYSLRGARPALAGYGRSDDVVTSVTLEFVTPTGRITVETEIDEPFAPLPWLARGAFEGLLHEGDGRWPAASPTAVMLWLQGRERAHAATAATAQAITLMLPVDGAATPFATVADDRQFAAVARLGDAHTVTVAGRGRPTGLALERIDPARL